jgi:hypothetical protein
MAVIVPISPAMDSCSDLDNGCRTCTVVSPSISDKMSVGGLDGVLGVRPKDYFFILLMMALKAK